VLGGLGGHGNSHGKAMEEVVRSDSKLFLREIQGHESHL
jgi:hypothetical protein